jgi:hypothetical protein
VRRKYQPPEAMTLRGHVRRAEIDVDLRNLAAKHIGCDAEPEPNSTKSAYHSVLTIGSVKLTQSRIRNRAVMPPRSAFRSQHALEGAQRLFSFMQPRKRKKVIQISAEQKTYLSVILIHGNSPKDKTRPSFIVFGFPDKECKSWVTQIDLMQRFPDVITEFYAPIVQAETEQQRVRLKKGVRRGGKERQA